MSFGKGSSGPNKGALSGTGLTKETQKLLEDSMQKRGLSLRAMQDVANSVQGGSTGWVDSMLGRTATFSAPPSKTNTLVNAPTYKKAGYKAPMPPSGTASFSGKRMAVQIPTPERDMWVGGAPAPDREALKEQLAQAMEHGSASAARKHEAARAAALEAAEEAAARSRQPVDVKEAMIDQLVQEVQERSEFLESMRAAGRHQDYDAQLKGEINQRLVKLATLGVDAGAGAPQGGTREWRHHGSGGSRRGGGGEREGGSGVAVGLASPEVAVAAVHPLSGPLFPSFC